MQDIVAEQTGKQRREIVPKADITRAFKAAGFAVFSGAEATVKHDEDQGDGADRFCKSKIREIDPHKSFGAKNHAEKDKGQKHRDTNPAGEPVT